VLIGLLIWTPNASQRWNIYIETLEPRRGNLQQERVCGDFILNSAVKEDENGADTRKHKGF
jgi:hypothetical protein